MRLALLFAVTALSSLAGLGCGATTPTANTNNTARAAPPVVVELGAVRVTLPSGDVIALDEAGAITLNGAAFGTLHADGRVTDPAGENIGALLADGQVSYRGTLGTFRVSGSQLVGSEREETLVVAPPDRLQTRRGEEVTADVPILGVTDSNHATVLFVVAIVAVEEIARDRARPRDEIEDEVAQDEDEEPTLRVSVDGAPQRGPADALVTIVVFSDFQCPFCSRVTPTLERVMERYGGDVRLVFRHNPLPFHANAVPAAEAAMEAYAQQGPAGFWRMHDLLFENQRDLDGASLERYAAQLGLDLQRFRLALQNHTHEPAVRADMALAARVGARGTPTFFLNGHELVGAQPFERFVEAIDSARAEAQRALAAGVPRARLYEQLQASALAEAPVPPPPPPRAPDPEDDPNRRWAVGDGRGAPVRGPQAAPVTIQVFSDFQCPFCARAVATLERVTQTYGSRVRIVFRHYPLSFHAWAQEAAELAVEIQRQRGDAAFWQFHDLVFEGQRTIAEAATPREGLFAIARRIRGFDARRATRALDQHTHAAVVQADMDAVNDTGLSIGTPSFFINGRQLRGAQPFEAFQALIDQELAARAPP